MGLRLLGARARVGPVRTWRSNGTLLLVCLRMDVGRHGRRAGAVGLPIPQELEPGLDMGVGLVQLRSTLVSIQSIVDLVIAALV